MNSGNSKPVSNSNITPETIDHLARLSRISVSAEEREALSHEFSAILNYVATIAKATTNTDTEPRVGVVSNVARKDDVTIVPGTYTKVLVDAAPRHDGEYIKVKKIIAD
jgi:aspartyl-tRNA(Asn)/glutamyl-tRNA(Gln) amidotransferase subunit C